MRRRGWKEVGEPTQRTEPKGKDKQGKPHKPLHIRVPTRGEFFGSLKKAARSIPSPNLVPDQSDDHGQGSEDH
jgi:hypothetical protein